MKMRLPRFSRVSSVLFFFLLAGGYAVYRLVLAGQESIPEEFENARAQGAFVAQSIVGLAGDLSGELQTVRFLDSERKYEEALTIVTHLAEKNEEMRTKAVELSQELEKMTIALASIQSFEAREAALDGIGNRLALISRLIAYNDEMVKLLNALRLRFAGGGASGEDVGAIIARLNNEVAAINDFNAKATTAMDRFDKLVR